MNQQNPQLLHGSLRQSSSRRGRWITEVLIAAAIVILLGVGGIKLYDTLHKTKARSSQGSTGATQSPQKNKSTEPTAPPTNTSASGSSNNGTVTQPSGD